MKEAVTSRPTRKELIAWRARLIACSKTVEQSWIVALIDEIVDEGAKMTDDDQLLADWRAFIAEAQKAERALERNTAEARVHMTMVAGQALTWNEAIDEAAKIARADGNQDPHIQIVWQTANIIADKILTLKKPNA